MAGSLLLDRRAVPIAILNYSRGIVLRQRAEKILRDRCLVCAALLRDRREIEAACTLLQDQGAVLRADLREISFVDCPDAGLRNRRAVVRTILRY